MPISIFLRLGKLIAGFAFMISPLALALPPGLLNNNHPAVQAVIAVQKTVTDTWMQQPEVLGTAVSVNESGAPVLPFISIATQPKLAMLFATCQRMFAE